MLIYDVIELIKTIEGVESVDWGEKVHKIKEQNIYVFEAIWGSFSVVTKT
jgi:hypothetical protein